MDEIIAIAQKAKLLRKSFYIIFSDPTDKAGERSKVTPDHLAHMHELEATGVLFAAGPFVSESDAPLGPGMMIVRAQSLEEAQAIAQRDPYHRGGYKRFRVQRWQMNEGSLQIKLSYAEGTFRLD